jgi:chromosome segregation ATPase
MAVMSRTGWIGGLQAVLGRIESTHEPRPETEDKIVEIPHGLEKLRKAIVTVQQHIIEAQCENADYAQAWKDCQAEIQAAIAKNVSKQRDLGHRLARLQDEWVRITQELGIRAEVVRQDAQPDLPSPPAHGG